MSEKEAKELVSRIEKQIRDMESRHHEELKPLERELRDAKQELGFAKFGLKAKDIVEYRGRRYVFGGYDHNGWAFGYLIRKSDGLESDHAKTLWNESQIKKVELS